MRLLKEMNVKKIIEYGLYLLVFLLPWQTRLIFKSGEINGGYFEYGTISLYAVDLVLIFLLVLLGIQKFCKIKNKNFQLDRIWYFLAVFELSILISIFVSIDKWIAFYGYIRFLLSVGIFYLVIKANYNRIKLYYAFLAGVFLQSSLAIWQFIFQKSFSSKWLGMATHNPQDLGTSVVETLSGERFLRAYGGLDHPNILGGYIVVGIILIFLFNIERKKNGGLRIKYIFFVDYIFALTFFVALFFTFSRGAWVALISALIVLFFLMLFRRDYKGQKNILKIVLIFGVTTFILVSQYSDLVLTRFSQDTRLEQKSSVERLESYSLARDIIKNNLFFGVGAGNYGLEVQDKYFQENDNWFYQPVHNSFLLILSEIGLLGGLCITLIILNILQKLYQKIGEIGVYFVTFLVIFSVSGLVDHYWVSLHSGNLLIGLILGIIYAKIIEK